MASIISSTKYISNDVNTNNYLRAILKGILGAKATSNANVL